MNGEEMQRAIEFLLEHQATLEQRIEQTNAQLAQTNEQLAQTNEQLAQTNAQLGELSRQVGALSDQVSAYAETQSEFIEIATRSIEALTAAQLRTERAVVQLAKRQDETDARLDRLTVLIERFVTGGRNGQE